MTQQEKQAVKEVLFDYNAETIVFADEIADRILRKLNELRKPSERPNVKDYFAATETLGAMQDEIVEAPRLYAYMQALEAYIDNLEAKPSEPETNIGKAGEELVSEMDAALMQPDKELLQALKETDKDLCVLESTMLQIEQRDHLAEGMAELVKKWRARNKQAISNYEKQSK